MLGAKVIKLGHNELGQWLKLLLGDTPTNSSGNGNHNLLQKFMDSVRFEVESPR